MRPHEIFAKALTYDLNPSYIARTTGCARPCTARAPPGLRRRPCTTYGEPRRRARRGALGGPSRRRSGARRRRFAVGARPAAPEDAPGLRADAAGDRDGAGGAGTFRRGCSRTRSRETGRRAPRSRRIRLIFGPFECARSRRRGEWGASSTTNGRHSPPRRRVGARRRAPRGRAPRRAPVAGRVGPRPRPRPRGGTRRARGPGRPRPRGRRAPGRVQATVAFRR